jgi:hypothetical protein
LTFRAGIIERILGNFFRGRAARRAERGNTMKGLVALVIVVWLVIGVVAAWQRGYFGDDKDVGCKRAGDTALTILAGPLNYIGANPKITCDLPNPSA